MDKQNTKENKQQAIYWRKRLNWYLNEASAEEYDEEEVQAIMDLLQVLDPEGSEEDYYTPEKGLERFRQTLEIRMRIQDEFERLQAGGVSLADYPDEGLDEKKSVQKYRPKHFTKFVTAAALVAAMFLGGTIGIYADRDGLFRKLDSGEDRNAVVSSTVGVGSGKEEYKIYERIEDVPLKYVSCLWTPSGISEDMYINQVELTEKELSIKVKCKYVGEKENSFIYTTKKSYKGNVTATDQIYDGFDFLREEQYNSVEVEYLIKENEDYTEYIALFEYGNSIYLLSSNCDFETIIDIIKQSILSDNL